VMGGDGERKIGDRRRSVRKQGSGQMMDFEEIRICMRDAGYDGKESRVVKLEDETGCR
jgi:hypothetical protein